MRGLQGTGCLGCLKHFPGIGAGEIDSHIEMPLVPLTKGDLMAQDLAPYIELFQRADDRVRVVMVSHGGFPNIDIKKGTTSGLVTPASINPHIVQTLLREELGFKHLMVTDDLEMGAIAKHFEIEDASVRAFEANLGNESPGAAATAIRFRQIQPPRRRDSRTKHNAGV